MSNKAKLKINNYSLIEILLKRLLKNFPKEQIFISTSVINNGLYLKRISEKYKINSIFLIEWQDFLLQLKNF